MTREPGHAHRPTGAPLQQVWVCTGPCGRPVVVRLPFLCVDDATGETLYDWWELQRAGVLHLRDCGR
jgi:hypothetical protein